MTIIVNKKYLIISSLIFIFMLAVPHVVQAFEKEINRLSQSMSQNIVTAGKKRVAVADFTDLQGNVTQLGRFLVKVILKEHKLSEKGLIDPATARKLGLIAGVDALLTGTITPFGDSVRLSVKMLDSASAEVIDANRGNIPKTKAIEELLAIDYSEINMLC